MNAAKAFEFDLEGRPEVDIGQVLDRLAHWLTDQNLATVCLRCHPRRHRHVAAEQVVSASHRGTHVSTDPHPDVLPLLGALAEVLLHADAAANSLSGVGEGDHEPVAL